MDPFRLLGLEPRFDIDIAQAEANWRALSRELHPDRHASAPSKQRIEALGRSIEVNEAWRVVRDPLQRAFALLKLQGINPDDGTIPPAPPALLAEMMELRETLSDAVQKRSRQALAGLRSSLETRAEAARGIFTEELHRSLPKALGALTELKYIDRALSEIEAAEEAVSL